MAMHCVRRSRAAVISLLAAELAGRRALVAWLAALRLHRPAETRALAARRRRVAERFWRLRRLFGVFAAMVARRPM